MEIDVAQYLLSRGVPVVPVSRARPRVLHVAEYPEPFAPQFWPTCWPRYGLRWPMASIACERRRKKPGGRMAVVVTGPHARELARRP
jgi:hypothetical protein